MEALKKADVQKSPVLDDSNSIDIGHSDIFFDEGDFTEVSALAISSHFFFATSRLVFRDSNFAASDDVEKIASGSLKISDKIRKLFNSNLFDDALIGIEGFFFQAVGNFSQFFLGKRVEIFDSREGLESLLIFVSSS